MKSNRKSRWTLLYKPLIRVEENDYYLVEVLVKYCFTTNRFNPKKEELMDS